MPAHLTKSLSFPSLFLFHRLLLPYPNHVYVFSLSWHFSSFFRRRSRPPTARASSRSVSLRRRSVELLDLFPLVRIIPRRRVLQKRTGEKRTHPSANGANICTCVVRCNVSRETGKKEIFFLSREGVIGGIFREDFS